MADIESPLSHESAGTSDSATGPSRKDRLLALKMFAVVFVGLTGWFVWQSPAANAHRTDSWLDWRFWLRPLEFNAPNRLPYFKNARLLHAAISPDGKRLLLAGEGGLLWVSKDGGVTWEEAKIDWRVEQLSSANPSALNAPPAGNQPSPAPATPAAPAEPLPNTKPGAPAPAKAFQAPSGKVLKEFGGAAADTNSPLYAAELPGKSQVPNAAAIKAQSVPLPVPTQSQRTVEPRYAPSNIPTPLTVNAGTSPGPIPVDEALSRRSSIFRLSLSGDGKHAWALAWHRGYFSPATISPNADGDTPVERYLSVLHSTDGGLSWKVETLFTDVESGADHLISAGKDGSAWLSLQDQPLKYKSATDDDWHAFAFGDTLVYVRHECLSFSADGSNGWVIGTDSPSASPNKPIMMAWHITAGSLDPSTVTHNPIFDEARNLQAGSRPEDVMLFSSESSHISRDAGKTWQKTASEKQTEAGTILGEDFKTGLVVTTSTDDSSIRLTLDGGKTTADFKVTPLGDEPVFSADGSTLLSYDDEGRVSLMRAPDWEQHFISRQTLSRYEDKVGAENEQQTFELPYIRLPAPIYYLIALVLLFVGYSLAHDIPLEKQETQPRASMADHFISDRPLRPGDPDALGSRRLALGLADYIRNQQTSLPLTVAITGAWGSGKSSIISLLRAALTEERCRAVEFNAWHHQNEENLLAALLDCIRKQAIPPVWTLDGLDFRWRLATRRLRAKWVAALGYGSAAVWSVAFIQKNPGIFGKLFQSNDFLANFTSTLGTFQGATGLAGLGAIGTALWRAWQGLGAFGLDPAHLVAASSSSAKLRDLKGKTSLRYEFAQEFGQITEAMDPEMRMIIFIDDLDRCQPEQMMTVLETVNFLTTSGKCVIVLGVDDEAVKDCLGKQLDWRISLEADGKVLSREKRHDFAARWLEKLVQVSVSVPTITNENVHALIGAVAKEETDSDTPATTSGKKTKPVRRSMTPWLKAAAVTALFAGIHALVPKLAPEAKAATSSSADVTQGGASGGPAVTALSTSNPSASVIGKSAASGKSTADSKDSGAEEGRLPELSPGKVSWPWWLAIVLPASLGFVVFFWRLIRSQLHPPVRDSPAVLKAIDEWVKPLQSSLTTPRAMKGFVNKVRFYEMMSRRQGKDIPEIDIAPEDLVAFGALSYCAPDWLDHGKLENSAALNLPQSCKDRAEHLLQLLKSDDTSVAVRNHLNLLKQSWKKRSPQAPAQPS